MQTALERTRANIAAELARHYSELSRPEPERRFSLCRLICSHLDGPGLNQGRPYEREVSDALSVTQGELARLGVVNVPWLACTTRAMSTQPGSKGGFVMGVEMAPGVQALRPWSVALQAGVTVLESLSAATINVPRLATAPTGAWLGEGAAATDTSPALGAVSLTQRTYLATTTVSEQLVRQGGESVDQYIGTSLSRVAGRSTDSAIFVGAGGVEPVGLLNAGLTTVSGTALTWATTLSAFKTLANAGVDPARISVVLSPAAAETLGQREKIATSGQFIFDNGSINTAPAFVSPDMGAGANAIIGDFSNVALALFAGGMRLDVSRASGFNNATVALRVMLEADAAVLQPAGFIKIGAIT